MGPPPVTVETDSEDEASSKAPTESSSSRVKAKPSDVSENARRGPTTGADVRISKTAPIEATKESKRKEENTHAASAATTKAEHQSKRSTPAVSTTSARTAEKGVNRDHKEGGQRGYKADRAPSRGPSVRSQTSQPDHREMLDRTENKHERQASRSTATVRPGSHARSSPESSRSSRAPSNSSREEMPPPAFPVQHRSRGRLSSSSHEQRPSSYHGGMGPAGSWYPPQASYPYYEHAPQPAPSAYAQGRPRLAVITGTTSSYSAPVTSQEMIAPGYDRSRMVSRAQTDYLSGAHGRPISARHPAQPLHGAPGLRDPSPMSVPGALLQDCRKPLSARRPAPTSMPADYALESDGSGTESESEYEEDRSGPLGVLARRSSQRQSNSFSERTLSARGLPMQPAGYGASPLEYPLPRALEMHGDSESDYLSSDRSRYTSSMGSGHHRRQSISSGAGTRTTAYSTSSGSAYRQSTHASSFDQSVEAEQYMRQRDQQAPYKTGRAPQLTQESIRAQEARRIEARQSSRVGGASVSSSRRASSYRVEDEQAVKIRLETKAGIELQIEGDTEGRPIRLSQKPGEQHAELIIGTGPSRRGAETVRNDDGGTSSGRSRGSGEKEASRVSRRTEGTSRSIGAAVSSRRERARTTGQY